METSFRVDPSDPSARAEARPLAPSSSEVAVRSAPAQEVAPEDDESLDWFVELLLAENASKA